MSFNTKKNEFGTKIAKIVDIYLHKCKYTDPEWIGYGAGTLQTTMTAATVGNLTLAGTQATKFNEPFAWLQFGGSTELVKCTVVSDTVVTVVKRGDFGTVAASHSIGASVTIKHSGEVDATCKGLTSCSAVNNYVKDLDVIFRFPSFRMTDGNKYFDGFKSEDWKSPTVKPSESIGSRGSSSIQLFDTKESDSYVPYAANRTSNGTLFTKLIARNPYFSGRKCVVYEGFHGETLDLNDYQKREYIIDDAQLDGGIFSVMALDPLIQTEDKKSKAPLASPTTLIGTIDDVSLTPTFSYTGSTFFFGILDAEFYCRIGAEMLKCKVTGANSIIVLTRASGGTEINSHDAESTVQSVFHVDKKNVVSTIVDLLTNYAGIDPVFLDDYTSVIAATSSIQLTAFITKPEAVKKLIDELLQTGLLTMWFSPTESKIKIVRSNNPNIEPISLTESDNIGIRSFKDKRLPDQQITRFGVAFGQRDVTKDKGEENFAVVYKPISADTERAENKGEVNEKDTFFNRWLLNDGSDPQIAFSMADDWVSKSAKMPVEVEIELDQKDIGVNGATNLDLASVVSITTSERVNVDGSDLTENYQVLSVQSMGGMRHKVKARLYQQPISGASVDLAITTDQENYLLAGKITTDGPREYSVLIDSNATIFSNNSSLPAFDYGSLHADILSIRLIVRGSIKGMGGAGGNGGEITVPSPVDLQIKSYASGTIGIDGGNALNVTVTTSIEVGGGVIYAGGGGSAGKYSVASSIPPISVSGGDGGCGGMGYGLSIGGVRGSAEVESNAIDYGVTGANGNNSGPGITGGATGGAYGAAGDNAIHFEPAQVTVLGGKSGVAIKKNGFSVTILSGVINPNGNIRGRVED
jgi:hypothetical protein